MEMSIMGYAARGGARGQHDVPQRVPDEVRVAVSALEGGDGAALAPDGDE